MNKKIVARILTAVILLTLPGVALAGASGLIPATAFGGTATGSDVSAITLAIRNIVNALLVLAALVAVIFVIIGGVRYITSQGDEDAAALAKNTIIFAILGIVVIILSAVLVNFVIAAAIL